MIKTYQNKPLIGISTNISILESGTFAGQKRIYIHQDYVTAIVKAGGIPLLLPLHDSPDIMKAQIQSVDGILFSGGQDIHPLHYKEEPKSCLEEVCVDRDFYELEILKCAHLLNKPILGVCRGLQLLNVAFGGTLYQDIERQFPTFPSQHSQKSEKSAATHTVNVVPHTRLYSIFESETLLTNSFHHQAVKDLAPDFFINAQAKDGIIEGIEKKGSSFILGVQWHPEMMAEKHPIMLKLFSAFVAAALLNKNKLNP